MILCHLLFSCSVVSDSETPWTAAHQASLSFTISQSLFKLMSTESVMPFNHLILCGPVSSYLQSFPASGSFPMSWLFASSGQSIAASESVLSMNIQGWFPLELTGLISLQSKGVLRVFSSPTIWKSSILQRSACFMFFCNIQFSSVDKSFLTLWDPVACRMPGFRVRHQVQGLAQTHLHQVSDAIQPFCPLSSPSLPSVKTMRGRYFRV